MLIPVLALLSVDPQTVEAPQPAPIIRPMRWRKPPGGRFPRQASAAGLRVGRATLQCQVGDGGRLTACVVISETPPGMGFGAAALRDASRAEADAVEGMKTQFTVQFTNPNLDDAAR